MEKRYLAMWLWLCESKLKLQVAVRVSKTRMLKLNFLKQRKNVTGHKRIKLCRPFISNYNLVASRNNLRKV